MLVIGWKLTTIVLGALIVILYITTSFQDDFFITNIALFLVLSFVSFILHFYPEAYQTKWTRYGDMLLHGAAALIILISSARFLKDIINLTNAAIAKETRRNNLLPPSRTRFEPYVPNETALAAASLGILQSVLYVIVLFLLWKKK